MRRLKLPIDPERAGPPYGEPYEFLRMANPDLAACIGLGWRNYRFLRRLRWPQGKISTEGSKGQPGVY